MLVLILFLILSSTLTAQDFYISNSIGTKMQKTQDITDSSWVISIENKGLEEERILYKDQSPYKSWLIKTYLEDGEHRTSEMYFYGDSLRTESILSSNDQILEELLYDSKGSLLVHKRYEYFDNGKLSKIIRDAETELPDYELKYRDEGSLISLNSDSSDRIEWRSGDFDNHYLDTLYLVEGSISSFLHYEEGKLKKKTIRNEQELIEETILSYSEEGIIEKEIISESDDKRRTERYYDKKGRLLMENIYLEDELIYSLINTIKDGVLLRKQERNANVRNIWVYEYSGTDSEGKEPSLIRQYRNGLLLKVSEYLEDKTIETLYRNNEAVMSNIIEKNQRDDS